MDVLQAQAFGAGSPRGSSGGNSGSTSGTISADFETFLRLLTTQMQHQDPLNPMESTEFASQLAEFSGVEQQVRTNDLLVGLQGGLVTLGMGQLGNWIGMEARAQMPVNFAGQSITLAGAPHVLADRMELIVRDEDGEIVQQMPIALSSDSFEWDGTGADGSVLPPGLYSFAVQNWSADEMLEERGAMVYGTVQEAALVGGEIWLTMEDGVSIPSGDVLGLRDRSG
jgi:flagellar basal-body rod modification protein FlgD